MEFSHSHYGFKKGYKVTNHTFNQSLFRGGKGYKGIIITPSIKLFWGRTRTNGQTGKILVSGRGNGT